MMATDGLQDSKTHSHLGADIGADRFGGDAVTTALGDSALPPACGAGTGALLGAGAGGCNLGPISTPAGAGLGVVAAGCGEMLTGSTCAGAGAT